MIYRGRRDAGRRLARELAHYEKDEPVVLALPRGGVVVAAEVAKTFHTPLDLVLVRKIGVALSSSSMMGSPQARQRAALQAIRERKPKKLVLAVPVAPTSTLEELSGLVDEIVCLQS